MISDDESHPRSTNAVAECPHTLLSTLEGGCPICYGAEVDLRGLERSALVDDLATFAAAAFPLVTGRDLVRNVATDALLVHLQAIADGKIRRLAIAIAPGLGKSTIASIIYPAWRWARDPSHRVITASHAHDLAVDLARKARRLVEGEWYRGLFGVQLATDSNRADHYATAQGGHRIAVGVGGALTGFRAHETICDDSLNAVDRWSAATRRAANEWFDSALSTRLDDPGRASQVVIQQRLHADDLLGHLIEQGGWEILTLPSEFNPSRRSRTSVWVDPRTEPGELVAPEIHTAEHLAERKATLGSTGYSCQYAQDPIDDAGGLFPRDAWRWYRAPGEAPSTRRPLGSTDAPAVALPDRLAITISIDAAFKGGAANDYVVALVLGSRGADRFVLDVVRRRMDFAATCAVVRALAARYPGAPILIEDAANGPAIISQLGREVSGLIAVRPEGGKEARAQAVKPHVESAHVFLPEGAAWVGDFVDECAAFPRGRNDDQVDAFTQAMLRATQPDPAREVVRRELRAHGAIPEIARRLGLEDEFIEHQLDNLDRIKRGERTFAWKPPAAETKTEERPWSRKPEPEPPARSAAESFAEGLTRGGYGFDAISGRWFWG